MRSQRTFGAVAESLWLDGIMAPKFDAAFTKAFDDDGKPKPALNKALDTVLRVQRPYVVSTIKSLRKKHPDETPKQIGRRLEKLYLRDVTVGGGAIGASAFIPGIGTATSVGLSFLAVGGYLERTAIYCQAMAELNGVPIEDPEKGRTMVMALMLGEDGNVLMSQILGQTGKASGLSSKWGLMMGKNDKKFSVSRTVRNMFIKRFISRQSGAMLGRALPFGLGAVVGGGANYAQGKKVIESVHQAFGDSPKLFPDSLQLEGRAPKFSDPKGEKPAEESSEKPVAELDGASGGQDAKKDSEDKK